MQSKHQCVIDALNKNGVPFLEVWFHGSRARGDNKSTSDWDYVAVLDDVHKKQYVDWVILVGKIRPFDNCDLQITLYSEADDEGSVLWWAKQEGVEITPNNKNV